MNSFWKDDFIYFLQVVVANIKLQYKDYFFNKTIYMSLFVWPVILFLNAYYSYKPFSQEVLLERTGLSSYEQLYIYLLIGFVAMMFFWSLVQSAWQSAYRIRLAGTLELLYMSPANRFAALLGNAIASLLGSVWMLVILSGLTLAFYHKFIVIHLLTLCISLGLLLVLSVLWGVFLNSLFLVSRDGGFIYTILEAPMEIFSGVKIPFHLMPFWAKAIGMIFPLTYIITALRKSLLFGTDFSFLDQTFLLCLLICFILIVLTLLILHHGERHAKKTGSATLF